MEWIRWAKQDDLWRFGGGGQMHRCGIDCDQQPGLCDERSERKQVRPAAQIDDGRVQFCSDLPNVRLIELRATAGQNDVDLRARSLDQLGPAFGLPKLFRACRTGMINREGIVDLRLAEEHHCFLLRRSTIPSRGED